MSVLVVGLSHKSAPVATLERAAISGDCLDKLLGDVFRAADVASSFVVSTCNRIEVYAEVAKFHSGVAAICELLARHTAIPLAELTPHLYVHYEDRAIQHLLAVACGLDSMVIGESQILGQVRQALKLAREHGTLNRVLADLGSVALRAGKRAHAETGIDRAGASLVSVGFAAAAQKASAGPGREPAGPGHQLAAGPGHQLADPGGPGHQPADPGHQSADPGHKPGGPRHQPAGPGGPGQLAGWAVLVVGAGSMSSLAATTAARLGAARVVVANRTRAHAQRLAAAVGGTVADLSWLPAEMAAADLVVSCTGAAGHVIGAEAVSDALGARAAGRRPLMLLDLALPRDVDPAVSELPGVGIIDLETLGDAGAHGVAGTAASEEDVAAVWQIIAAEFAAQALADRAARVAPTVVALRAKAAEVVDAELARLDGRIAGLDARNRGEIAQSMRRIADKLLHAPTVRVKELAGSPDGDSYETALRVLFDLDPAAVQSVITADAGLLPGSSRKSPS
jgi:glutamyl-tRNA reductase